MWLLSHQALMRFHLHITNEMSLHLFWKRTQVSLVLFIFTRLLPRALSTWLPDKRHLEWFHSEGFKLILQLILKSSTSLLIFHERIDHITDRENWSTRALGQPRGARPLPSAPAPSCSQSLIIWHLLARRNKQASQNRWYISKWGWVGWTFWPKLFEPPTCRSRQDQPT